MNTKNILFGILIMLIFATGLAVGHFGFNKNIFIENKPATMNTTPTTTTETSTAQSTAASVVANMSEDQKKMLSALGIDVNKITPEMITCAETSLGATRTAEVKNGASLSFAEKAKLIACY
jgi:hypothetical protein